MPMRWGGMVGDGQSEAVRREAGAPCAQGAAWAHVQSVAQRSVALWWRGCRMRVSLMARRGMFVPGLLCSALLCSRRG